MSCARHFGNFATLPRSGEARHARRTAVARSASLRRAVSQASRLPSVGPTGGGGMPLLLPPEFFTFCNALTEEARPDNVPAPQRGEQPEGFSGRNATSCAPHFGSFATLPRSGRARHARRNAGPAAVSGRNATFARAGIFHILQRASRGSASLENTRAPGAESSRRRFGTKCSVLRVSFAS